MAKVIKGVRWFTSAAASANWFSADVSVGGSSPVRHTLQCELASTADTIEVIMVHAGVTAVAGLNGNLDVSAGALFKESYIVIPNTTYNVRNIGTGQFVTAIVVEDEDDLNIS